MNDLQSDWLAVGVARIIAARRLELKISQEELARRSGVHRTYISDVERGARNMSLRSLARLAEALEMPPSLMLHLVENNRGCNAGDRS